MNVNYYKPAIVSLNNDRDKGLVARSLVINLCNICIVCKREYTPYVQFPLVYSVACGTCRPWQSLNRFPASDIPSIRLLTRNNIKSAISYFQEHGKPYPTCKQLFEYIKIKNNNM